MGVDRGRNCSAAELSAIDDLEPVSLRELAPEIAVRVGDAGLPSHKVDETFVRREVARLVREGFVGQRFLPEDVDHLGRPRPGAERVFELTDDGDHELDRLRRLAGDGA